MRSAAGLVVLVACYRGGVDPATTPGDPAAPPAPSSLVGAARPASYSEVQAVAISRLIPTSEWPDVPGRAVGVVFAAGPQPWGASVNNLRGFDTRPDSEVYRFSLEGASSYGVYWMTTRGGMAFDRRQPCKARRAFASAGFKPGDQNTHGLVRRAHVVELAVNSGVGGCGSEFVATGTRILDRTDAVWFDTETVLGQLRKRFDATVTAHANDLASAMNEKHRKLEHDKREKLVAAMPTWLANERQLEVLFIVKDEHSGTIYGYGALAGDRTLFARPRPPDPIHFVHGAAMAVRYTVDHEGKLVGETVYLPAAYTAHRGGDYYERGEDDWYGR